MALCTLIIGRRWSSLASTVPRPPWAVAASLVPCESSVTGCDNDDNEAGFGCAKFWAPEARLLSAIAVGWNLASYARMPRTGDH